MYDYIPRTPHLPVLSHCLRTVSTLSDMPSPLPPSACIKFNLTIRTHPRRGRMSPYRVRCALSARCTPSPRYPVYSNSAIDTLPASASKTGSLRRLYVPSWLTKAARPVAGTNMPYSAGCKAQIASSRARAGEATQPALTEALSRIRIQYQGAVGIPHRVRPRRST